jgi:hypothetical protein
VPQSAPTKSYSTSFTVEFVCHKLSRLFRESATQQSNAHFPRRPTWTMEGEKEKERIACNRL